ncbi:MAG: PAAR domain-containing protein [Myxococcales bacterium]|nr:PAAR domain-containing protein [Myxococcales bacterium]MCB9737521.1 PAAR domain-containing protein [Deltaproteobacteria bacterium]
MPAQSRIGDNSQVGADSHGCPACPHGCIGPGSAGSPDVYVNALPALRYQDTGIHAACCGSNTWVAVKGSDSVFINGRPAHRVDDDDDHCGGAGKMVAGSPNVFTGGGKTDKTIDDSPPPAPAPHDLSHTIKLMDALGRELKQATVTVSCPHEADRKITFSGTTTVSGLCEFAHLVVSHAVEKVKWLTE